MLLVPQISHDDALGPVKEALEHVDSLGDFALFILLGRGLLLATSFGYHDPGDHDVGVLDADFAGLGCFSTLIVSIFITGIRSPRISVLTLFLIIRLLIRVVLLPLYLHVLEFVKLLFANRQEVFQMIQLLILLV